MYECNERGQSIQVGAVLLFGILIVAFTAYSAFVVPQQNREVEFDHFQSVRGDMKEVRDAALTAGGSGTSQSHSVRLGTQYPARLVALNPPDPGGTLRTAAQGQLEFHDGFDITSLCGYTGTTRALVYEPNYNELEAQAIGYDNSAVYINGSGGYVILTEQNLLDGRTIQLTPLDTSFSESGVGRETLTFQGGPANGTVNTVDEEITLTMPTRLPASEWATNDRLFGDVDAVSGVTEAQHRSNAVNVTLRADTYTVACRAVGINGFPASGEALPPGIDTTGYGEGSTETYDPDSPEPETLATKGGRLEGIINASTIVLRDPAFSMTKAGDSQVSNTEERHLQVGFKLQNRSFGEGNYRRYFIIVGEQDGLTYKIDSGEPNNVSWQQRDVSLYRDETGGRASSLFSGEELAASTLDSWLTDSEKIDLLAEENYVDSGTVESDLQEVESFMNNGEETALVVTDLHGRVVANVSGEKTTAIGGGNTQTSVVSYVGTTDGNLKSIDSTDNTVQTYALPGDPTGIGRKSADLGASGSDPDIPFKSGNNGYLRAVADDDTDLTLDSLGIADAPIGVGDWDDDGNQEVLYATANNKLKQYEPESGSATLLTRQNDNTIGQNQDVTAVAGVGDFAGSANNEVVFVQNNKLKYVSQNGTKLSKVGNIGLSQAVSTPADFDDDSDLEVAVQDNNGGIELYTSNGADGNLNPSGYSVVQSPMAASNWVGDSTPEIIVVDGNDRLRYLSATDTTDTAIITDSNGGDVTADSDYGTR